MSQNHSPSFDDRDLLMLLRQDGEYGFALLYEKYWAMLMRLAEPFLEDADTCQEIVQELFVSLYTKREDLQIKISISAYLYVSLRNRIRNHIRHRAIYNRHIGTIRRSYIPVTNDVEQFINRSELEREIMVCLSEMPEKCRQVYLLYNQGRCPQKQIAVILNRPVDTVEKQFRKAVLLLRQHLSFFQENGDRSVS
jgi:RNA polymerase sigma factor (sigma-70 family)